MWGKGPSGDRAQGVGVAGNSQRIYCLALASASPVIPPTINRKEPPRRPERRLVLSPSGRSWKPRPSSAPGKTTKMQTIRGPNVCVLKLTRWHPNPRLTVSGGGPVGGVRRGGSPRARDRCPYVRDPESPPPLQPPWSQREDSPLRAGNRGVAGHHSCGYADLGLLSLQPLR